MAVVVDLAVNLQPFKLFFRPSAGQEAKQTLQSTLLITPLHLTSSLFSPTKFKPISPPSSFTPSKFYLSLLPVLTWHLSLPFWLPQHLGISPPHLSETSPPLGFGGN